MKIKTFTIVVLLMIAAVTFSSDIGEIKDGSYINNYFNLKVPVPAKFTALDEKKRMQLMAQGANIIAGDDSNLKKMLEASKLNSINLFSFSRYPLGKPVAFNHSIICIAENIELYKDGIKSGKDYFYHVKKILNRGKLKYNFGNTFTPKQIGECQFESTNLQTKFGNLVIKQKYYLYIYKDYVISIVITFGDDQQRKELEGILDTIEIKKP